MLKSVNAARIGADMRMPPNRIRMESASRIPFRETINSPTVKGKRNNKTNPSSLNMKAQVVKPCQKSKLLSVTWLIALISVRKIPAAIKDASITEDIKI